MERMSLGCTVPQAGSRPPSPLVLCPDNQSPLFKPLLVYVLVLMKGQEQLYDPLQAAGL